MGARHKSVMVNPHTQEERTTDRDSMLLANAPAHSASDTLANALQQVRQQSVAYCEPLALEDYGLQAVAETSPPKWHLAHTSWFFETFILKPFANGYSVFHPQFEYLFNSYYNGIGEQFPRPSRGLLSRPTVAEVLAYREHVDRAMLALLEALEHPQRETILTRTLLGIHHEHQHQELFFTDIKFSLHINPLTPAYRQAPVPWQQGACPDHGWLAFDGGLSECGAGVNEPFVFDNETPRHRVWLEPFSLARSLVTNDAFLAFVEDGGYRNPALWLADGWAEVRQHGWQHPLYWRQRDNQWFEYTLHGEQPLDPHRPVCHLSAYEADAFARWAGARLPTEFEWEHAAAGQSVSGQFVDSAHLQPLSGGGDGPLQDLFGSVWEWTSSAYSPYPGFRMAEGAIGEYNGKFMCNQLVLRGGSCVSDRRHIRASYRNFFYPRDRWQFSGLRLARDQG